MSFKSPLPFSGESVPRIPKLRHHRPSGRAVVTLNLRDCYCGDWGSKAAKAEYDRLISLWLANGRRLDDDKADFRIAELIDRYLDFANGYYKPSKRNGEANAIDRALKALGQSFGRDRVGDFGPLKLKALRQQWIDEGRVRSQINAAVRRVIRCFKWAVENELVGGEVLHALKAVPGLRAGRTTAKESPPIQPVSDANIDAALPFMSPQVRAMVQLQRLSGARPGEIVQLTPAMIDRSKAVWEFRPTEHKSKHHGRERIVFFGPKCQEILGPLLDGKAEDSTVFSPAEALASIRAERAANRKTPMSCGNSIGTNRQRRPKWVPSEAYTTQTYAQAIARACASAFPPPAPLAKLEDETDANWRKRLGAEGWEELKSWRRRHAWGPHRIRHTFATQVRKAFGLEEVQVLLGHARADVTQIYAERDATKAAAVAALIG